MVTFTHEYCLKRLFQDRWALVEDDDPLVLLFEIAYKQLHIILARVGVPGPYPESEMSISWPADAKTVRSTLQNSSVQPLLEEVVSVILSGEGADTDFSELRAALREIAPVLLERLQVPAIEIVSVSAVGVACVARQCAIFRKDIKASDRSYEHHDEV